MRTTAHTPSAASFTVPPRPYYGISPRHTLLPHAPFSPPGISPDIIGSDKPVDDARAAFGSDTSWNQIYEVAPRLGVTNYYYVRGRNCGHGPSSGRAMVYRSPAYLLPWPTLWTGNPLPNSGGESCPIGTTQADEICVAETPFTWTDTPIIDDADGYYAFVTQFSDSDRDPVPPAAHSLMELSQILYRRDLAWRNSCPFDGGESSWRRVLTLDVPYAVPKPTRVCVNLLGRNLTGATVGLRGPNGYLLSPNRFVQANQMFGIDLDLEPGTATLEVHFWNTAGTPIPPGATLTLAADLPIPDPQLHEAIERGVIDNARTHRLISEKITSTPVAPLGAASFIAI